MTTIDTLDLGLKNRCFLGRPLFTISRSERPMHMDISLLLAHCLFARNLYVFIPPQFFTLLVLLFTVAFLPMANFCRPSSHYVVSAASF